MDVFEPPSSNVSDDLAGVLNRIESGLMAALEPSAQARDRARRDLRATFKVIDGGLADEPTHGLSR
jgi:hypothetical protein